MEFHLPSGLLKCPPLLDLSYFVQWKSYTKFLIGVEHPQLWMIVEKGPLEITKQNRDEWDNEDYHKCRKNARALHILYCALSSDDFYRVATCNTAKQVWDALTLAYEGADYQAVLLASEFGEASLQETDFEPMEKGRSTMHPPLLVDNSDDFQQWKARFRAYIESRDPQLWHIIEDGELKPTKLDENGLKVEKCSDEWDENDYPKLSKNARAIWELSNCLPVHVYDVMMYDEKTETAKILWKALNDRYECSESLKQIRIGSLERDLELFKMSRGESIKEMLNRFVTIIGKLALLGEQVSMPAQVRKIMRSLPFNDEYMALNGHHEGSEDLKQMRISSLEHDLELFKMSKGESIKEMFNRFVAIIGKLALLGEEVSMPAQVRKIMRSLPFKDDYMVFIVNTESSNDWAKMSLDELFAKLWAFEVRHGLMKSRRNR